MSYHQRMMNIPITYPGEWGKHRLYEWGHKDARHDAAEIAAEADGRIAELEAVLRAILDDTITDLAQANGWQPLMGERYNRKGAIEYMAKKLTAVIEAQL